MKIDNPFQKVTTIQSIKHYFHHGMSLMFGGFGGVGSPPTIIEAILEEKIKDLVLIGNDAGFPEIGIGKLVSAERVKKIIASHIGSNPMAGKLMNEGKLEVEFSPQGTLAERIRAGGVGLGAVLTDVGIDNEWVSKGKQTVSLHHQTFLVEPALTADVSIVFAKTSDEFGNLIYDKSARNMNPLVAMAGAITIAEVEEIVPMGKLDCEAIVTPGVFVDFIVPSKGVNWRWAWE